MTLRVSMLALAASAHAGVLRSVHVKIAQHEIAKLRQSLAAKEPELGVRDIARRVDRDLAARVIEAALHPDAVGRALPRAALCEGYAPTPDLAVDPALAAVARRVLELTEPRADALTEFERAALGRIRAGILTLRASEASDLRDVAWGVLDMLARELDPTGALPVPLPVKTPARSGLLGAVEAVRATVDPVRVPADFRREAIAIADAEADFVREVQNANYRLLDDLLARMADEGVIARAPRARPGLAQPLRREAAHADEVLRALERRVVVPYDRGVYALRKREIYDHLTERVRAACATNLTRGT